MVEAPIRRSCGARSGRRSLPAGESSQPRISSPASLAFAEQSDLSLARAEACMDVSEVLEHAGRRPEAAEAVREAIAPLRAEGERSGQGESTRASHNARESERAVTLHRERSRSEDLAEILRSSLAFAEKATFQSDL
jgi:hypothetical protein